MRALQRTFLFGLLGIVTACGSETADPDDGAAGSQAGTYTIDFAYYTPTDPASPLRIQNDTIVIPLARGERYQRPTFDEPGDEVIAYTKVACNPSLIGSRPLDPAIDPRGDDAALGDDGPFVHLTRIVIEQIASESEDVRALGDATCFTYRTRDGEWHAVAGPSDVTIRDNVATSTLTLDAREVDLVALYLAASTTVSRISYDATAD